MILYFANFLDTTSEPPAATADIAKIVVDYVVHAKRLQDAGASIECEATVLAAARKAQLRLESTKAQGNT